MNSVCVVNNLDIINATEGSNVTLIWDIEGYETSNLALITDPSGGHIYEFIYGHEDIKERNHAKFDANIWSFARTPNANLSSFRLTITEANLQHAGTYVLAIENKLSTNTTLFIYGKYDT